MSGSHSGNGPFHSCLGPGFAAEANRSREVVRDPFRSERHHRDAGLGDRIRLANLQRANRYRRRCDRSRDAKTRSDLAGKDALYCLRIFHARANAQPAGFGAHAGRKLQRVGSRRRGGDGACRSRNPDQGVGAAAGFLLWRYWIQGQLWSSPHGGRAPSREEPGYTRVLHTYTSRYARALGIDGTSRGPVRGFCAGSARTRA
jgi:hypothetical protein